MNSLEALQFTLFAEVMAKSFGLLQKNDAVCCGVTVAQCQALNIIGREQNISLIHLAKRLGTDKSTVSRTVDNLAELNLVFREQDSGNRRYIIIQLTPEGKIVYENIRNSMEIYCRKIMESIPENKRSQILESIVLLTEVMTDTKCC